MIQNNPTIHDEGTELFRSAIEHRATWFALLIDEACKQGANPSFADKAIFRCGQFHGDNKYTKTDSLPAFAKEFANENVQKAFEMELVEHDENKLSIDFHYCPLVAAWKKLGIPEDKYPALCRAAMEGDRGIISTFDAFEFELGKTIADGNDICEIRITKPEKNA